MQVPWPIGIILRTSKRRSLKAPLRTSVRIPGVRGGTRRTDDPPSHEGLRRLRDAFDRLQKQATTLPNPVLGPLTHPEWIQNHLRHAELHLGFLHPQSPRPPRYRRPCPTSPLSPACVPTTRPRAFAPSPSPSPGPARASSSGSHTRRATTSASSETPVARSPVSCASPWGSTSAANPCPCSESPASPSRPNSADGPAPSA
ncbi:MAG: DUF1569 domain-containing protein [Phycisphaerae bacterium]|nr:DUF1569 domain-containing protein [Phycisphaerae bacterium]